MSKDWCIRLLWSRIGLFFLSVIAGSTCREVQGFVSGGMKIIKKQETMVDAHSAFSLPKKIQDDDGIQIPSPLMVDIQPLQDEKDVWKFLTIAAHETDLEVVKSNPDLARYANNYDSSKDIGFVANEAGSEDGNGKGVGAAWVRFWSDSNRGYGYFRDDIPELAIGVEHTGRGIGSTLMKALIDEVSSRTKIPAICLSCRDDNPALRLYERLGFRKISGTEVTNRSGSQSFTMILWLPQVRKATSTDLPLIVNFVQKKAAFDRNMGAFQGTTSMTEQFLKESLFDGPIAHAHVLLVEIDSRPIGIALYYFHFSSFAGRPSLWLDDLYIDEEFRSLGAGKSLIDELILIARAQKCTHMSWTADAQNEKGLAFYHRLGATITQTNGRSHIFRLGIKRLKNNV